MNIPILVGTIIIELLIIVGVGWAVNAMQKNKMGANEFATSNRSMPAITIGATQALTCLGGGQIMGMVAAGWSFGVGVYWYALSSGIMLIIMLCFTGPWIRRFGFTTINQLFKKMFDQKTSILVAGIGAGTAWGVLTLELQGVGSIISSITGWPVTIGCIIGGVMALLYVLMGGMKQVGWVNVINAVFMYTVAIIGVVMLGYYIPGGWGAVNDFYLNGETDWMINILSNADTWKVYIIGTIIAQLFYCPIGPQAAQVSASAKNVRAIRTSVLIAVPVNVIFGAIMLAFSLASLSIAGTNEAVGAAAGAGGPPLANFTMLLNYLPPWVVCCMFASFIAAMLSTVAVQILSLSTILMGDIFFKYFIKEKDDKKRLTYLRIGIVAFTILGTGLSVTLPGVDGAIVWLFAWMLPAFWIFVFGMFWKRSTLSSFWTLLICGVFNMVWSLTPLPDVFGLGGNNNSIGLAVVALIISAILTAVDKQAKPSMVSCYKKDKYSVMSKSYVAELKAKEAAKAASGE